jgi:hypothetical protein
MTVLHPNVVASYSSAPSVLPIRWEPPPQRSKIATVISLLTRQALKWAMADWKRGEEELVYFVRFMALFRAIFDHPPVGREGGKKLLQL